MSEQVSVFGLGYVGLITSLGLADQGHSIIGVDIAEDKVDRLNDGSPTIQETGVEERLSDHLESDHFHATTDAEDAIHRTQISLICVGTPTGPDGSIDLRSVENVCRQIGVALKNQPDPHTIILRSTVLPGTSQKVMRWLEEASQRSVPEEVNYIYQPEFMREGSAFEDFYNPPFTVFAPPTEEAQATINTLYPDVEAPTQAVELSAAEILKYACNAFHALKISFANEIGRMSDPHGIDAGQVMDVLCRDTRLNISDAYLDPGFAFGGSCLPKDLKALSRHARDHNVELPVLQNVLASNDRQIAFVHDRLRELGIPHLGVVGLTFKSDTDDVRESPMVKLCARLKEEEWVESLRIYEPVLQDTTLHGSNRLFIEQTFPSYSEHLVNDLHELQEHTEALLLGPAAEGYRAEVMKHLRSDMTVMDVTGAFKALQEQLDTGKYHGLFQG